MKQENKFVAQLFHYLAPFVDINRDFYICIDGGAAKHHAATGSKLLDANVPDLWLTFIGLSDYVGIEAKIIDKGCISIRQGQLTSWKTNGNGAYVPKFWVATNRELSKFFCWRHTDLLPRLDSSSNTTANVSLSLSQYPAAHESSSIAELALYILMQHRTSA